MRSSIYIIILAFSLVGCEQPTEFERDNPSDPATNSFIPNAIESFDLTLNENHIRLEWKPGSEFINGYLLDKTNAAGEFEEVQTFDKNITVYSDESISPFSGEYRIQYLGERDVESNPALTRSYDINPTNFSIANVQNDGIDLEWSKNTYFETTASLERKSNTGNYEKITTIPTANGEFRFTGFGKEAIGKNIFRFTEYSEIDSSVTLESSEVRLPKWEYYGTIGNLINPRMMVRIDNSVYGLSSFTGFNDYYSYKFNLDDFQAEKRANAPNLGFSYSINNATVINDRILTILSQNHYAFYDPANDSWEVHSNDLLDNRMYPSVIKIDDHRVLVSGGARNGRLQEILSSALILDVNTNTWTEIADLNEARFSHFSVELDNGDILVAGNRTGFAINRVEIYNLETNQWQLLDRPPFSALSVIKLDNGRVMISSNTTTVEFNPNTYEWKNVVNYELNDQFVAGSTLHKLPGGNILSLGLSSFGNRIYSQIYVTETSDWYRIGNLELVSTMGYGTMLENNDFFVIYRRDSYRVYYAILEYSKFF